MKQKKTVNGFCFTNFQHLNVSVHNIDVFVRSVRANLLACSFQTRN